MIPASKLILGQKAKVRRLEESRFSKRLAELGFVEGSELQFCYKAPLGCPIAFQINHSIIGLRKEEASTLLVDLI